MFVIATVVYNCHCCIIYQKIKGVNPQNSHYKEKMCPYCINLRWWVLNKTCYLITFIKLLNKLTDIWNWQSDVCQLYLNKIVKQPINLFITALIYNQCNSLSNECVIYIWLGMLYYWAGRSSRSLLAWGIEEAQRNYFHCWRISAQ